MRVDLDSGWELATSLDGPWQPACVPGNWYLDGIDGVERVHYRCEFDLAEGSGDGWWWRLHIGAADYRAEVVLDDAVVGEHTGGFAPFWFDLHLAAGHHTLLVTVDCPTDPFGEVWPHAKTAVRGVMGHHDARPGGWTRRGQERSTGGLWGGVWLTRHHALAIDAVAIATSIVGPDVEVDQRVQLTLAGAEPRWVTVRAELHDGDGVAAVWWTDTWIEPGRNDVHLATRVAAPRLWWPWDHGDPFRYRLRTLVEADDVASGDVPGVTAAAAVADGAAADVVVDERMVGLRSIEVGSDWIWRINGRPVFVRGCNYIGEQWLSALTPERASADVDLAVQANLNTLRVHAHVTAPAFYDACDAAGVLVWQDLPMQWGYADSAEVYRVTRQMVHEVVELHGWRPSVVYWAAHNEAPWNEPWMMDDAGSFRPDRNQRLDHELAALFRRIDPSRPVIANSGAGDGHTYPGWYHGHWTDVTELPGGTFVSEYGAQAVPCRETLRTFLAEDATVHDWTFHGFQHHEIHTKVGVTVLTHTIDEIIERTQHYQARSLQYSTEVYRRKKRERVQGVIPFMLVDPWPCVSWSVLDHLRRPKAGYQALARAMQPVLASIEGDGDRFTTDEPPVFGVWWINDLARALRGAELWWRLVTADGEVLATDRRTVHVLPDAARRVMQAGPFRVPPGRYAIEAAIDHDGHTLGANRWEFTVADTSSGAAEEGST